MSRGSLMIRHDLGAPLRWRGRADDDYPGPRAVERGALIECAASRETFDRANLHGGLREARHHPRQLVFELVDVASDVRFELLGPLGAGRILKARVGAEKDEEFLQRTLESDLSHRSGQFLEHAPHLREANLVDL